MPKPTPSPAPASGAETPAPLCTAKFGDLTCIYDAGHSMPHLHVGGFGTEYRWDDQSPKFPALPTPPSDAGTSERETGAQFHSHVEACATCGNDDGSLCSTGRRLARAMRAAPAAEGPRHLNGVSFETFRDVAEGRPAAARAALPGAEAGTPDEDTADIRLLRLVEAGRVTLDAADALHFLRRLAALTSEVRALREDKARLDWLDGMARLHEKPVFDVSKRLDGERFTIEFAVRHRYDWFHAPTLREAIDAARLASPSPTGAPASHTSETETTNDSH